MQHGVFYLNEGRNRAKPIMKLLASYAYRERKNIANRFRAGEGLVGQCAFEKERILLTDVPADYIQINSGLGEAPPLNIVVLPVLFEGQVKAVIELASFQRFSDIHLTFLDQLTESIGIVLNTITATMRTEELLKQSQSLATELQTRQAELTETNRRLQEQAKTLQESEERLRQQQDELQQTNEELEEKANLLAKQNLEVERKNQEIERARRALEEKAEQLALTSKYKSEFLANMSHELRTPLNSMLILAQTAGRKTKKTSPTSSVEFARTIYSSGSDLLDLINEILDLSKIESGMMEVEVGRGRFSDLAEYIERTFRQVAHDKGLEFDIELDHDLPHGIITDQRRLQQVLEESAVQRVQVHGKRPRDRSTSSRPRRDGVADNADAQAMPSRSSPSRSPIPASASPADKHRIIFEAFQQADGTITAASTAGRDWVSRSAARSPRCSAAKSGSTAWSARAARSRSICRRLLHARTRREAAAARQRATGRRNDAPHWQERETEPEVSLIIEQRRIDDDRTRTSNRATGLCSSSKTI